MSKSLHDRVESFLNHASFLTFAYTDSPPILGILFEKESVSVFNDKKSHEDLRDFFRGRKIKLIVHTPDETLTTVSLVDIETVDTIRLKNVKFVRNNIIAFVEAGLPENEVFLVSLMCPALTPEGEKAMGVHPYWADKKPLKIHGYSITDNRLQ